LLPMIRIAISVEAFEAIARTLPLGSVGYENSTNEQGQKLIWLDRAVIDRLRSLGEPGESHSDVILRVAPDILAKLRAMRGSGEDFSDVILRLAARGRDPMTLS